VQEGGCGVLGLASSDPVCGRHICQPAIRMHNRGNGKGGGIAAACLNPEQLGVDACTLRNDYLLQVAILDSGAENEVEKAFINPFLRIDHREKLKPAADFRDMNLEMRPPDIVRYFVRVDENKLLHFAGENNLTGAPLRMVEDEFVYRNSIRLNEAFYSAVGVKRAFVLSHARNIMIFKIVGYAEQVVWYYGLEDLDAQVWIAHQRYPTKGRVWHPAGSHPFIGMNEALVHNGDFANYFSICEYLRQRNVAPQFLTDTEVSVLLFDLWHRVYGYPLEYVIEALAPTTELDFEQLPVEKKKIYRAIHTSHMHGSPDGPWFFIIARSDPDRDEYQLVGITDTSMLRPQVFALQEGEVSIGLIASEKQAIDATLESLSAEDTRFGKVADLYWNARGGSHTDGGAFSFTLKTVNTGEKFRCADKFGNVIRCAAGERRVGIGSTAPMDGKGLIERMSNSVGVCTPGEIFSLVSELIPGWTFENIRWITGRMEKIARRDARTCKFVLGVLARLNDWRYDCGKKKRSDILQIVREAIDTVLDSISRLSDRSSDEIKCIGWNDRKELRARQHEETTLVVFARDFPPEGNECDARLMASAYQLGWRSFIIHGMRGQRFAGCGLGQGSDEVRVDVFGSSGDYLASGIDGMEMHVHGSGQDQIGQIMKRGRLVVYGDVGQAFMYGAKGGQAFVMGNAAGRPLINAVGNPRVVINGTCLDYLAESFMAGDPLAGGGFVVLNGIEFDNCGRVHDQKSPYPGSNLFSLASGGAVYVRDPHRKLVPPQLNGGEFSSLTDDDWRLILPYLERNEELFGISIQRDLLTVEGVQRRPTDIYRKVRAVKLMVLSSELDLE